MYWVLTPNERKSTMNINFIINEPASEYHARSRSGEFMSSHLLADFRESPALYRKKITGEIEDKNSSAFVIGRAAHCLILEGRKAFDRDYVVSDGPINPGLAKPTAEPPRLLQNGRRLKIGR